MVIISLLPAARRRRPPFTFLLRSLAAFARFARSRHKRQLALGFSEANSTYCNRKCNANRYLSSSKGKLEPRARRLIAVKTYPKRLQESVHCVKVRKKQGAEYVLLYFSQQSSVREVIVNACNISSSRVVDCPTDGRPARFIVFWPPPSRRLSGIERN